MTGLTHERVMFPGRQDIREAIPQGRWAYILAAQVLQSGAERYHGQQVHEALQQVQVDNDMGVMNPPLPAELRGIISDMNESLGPIALRGTLESIENVQNAKFALAAVVDYGNTNPMV